MVNRGRHKIKKYPKECYALEYFNAFKQAFTPKEAELLIQRMMKYSEGIIDLQEWENDPRSCIPSKGFIWYETTEGQDYWYRKMHTFIDLKNKYERSLISN